MRATLKDTAWVWTGQSFELPELVAFQSRVPAAPYLFVLPHELGYYRVLLSNFGVRDEFGAHDYIGVLARMAAECDHAAAASGYVFELIRSYDSELVRVEFI